MKLRFLLCVLLFASPAVAQLFPDGGAGSNNPGCFKYTKTAANLTTVSGTEDEVLFNLPARGVITGLKVKHSVAFSGGILSAMTVSVGDSSSDTFYSGTFDIFQAVADDKDQDTPFFGSSTFAARDVFGHFIATDDTMDDVTVGSVDFMICWAILP